ncbi:MAG: helix-turn-helix transcriptional regulator [Actinomyces urogenitalis]|uniref:helix-turn-helix transcriptional regulator n=1 Tax=Actinomyces urogenitalis TaxID=103621 RepID=UPI002A80890E|nr:helix-turn-helix transcriptional regulator [Actinomyces urogenitalis]MDY3678140.1 helix-turn-helix transcriptional regulator [Actinomyces urogenitalis]
MSDSHAHELAEAVRKARVECGYPTQKALASAMGVNPKTIQNLENASRSTYSATTLSSLDSALRWTAGSAAALLSDGTEPQAAEREGGPVRLMRLVRERMSDLGLTLGDLIAATGTQEPFEELLLGRLPDVQASTAIELALQWEPGDLPRVLLGEDPRPLPPDLARTAGCAVTEGVAETVEAARKVASAVAAVSTFTYEPVRELDTRSRMFALAWLLGFDLQDFDLLNGRQYQAVIRTLEAAFEREVGRLQMADPRYGTEPTPSGFTRAEIDTEMARGGDANEAIRRLVARATPTSTADDDGDDDDAVVVTGRFPAAPPAEDDEQEPAESGYLQMAALDPGYPPDAENEQ